MKTKPQLITPEFFHDPCMDLELEFFAMDSSCQHGALMDAPDMIPSGKSGSYLGAFTVQRPDIYPHWKDSQMRKREESAIKREMENPEKYGLFEVDGQRRKLIEAGTHLAPTVYREGWLQAERDRLRAAAIRREMDRIEKESHKWNSSHS